MLARSRILLLVSAITLVYITFNYSNWRDKNMLGFDTSYYYLYLPATVIYHDPGKLAFYPEKIREYNINGQQPTYELYPQPATGNLLNKYAVGVSICELPCFLIAHAYCLLSKEYPADGFSMPYRVSVVFSGLLWVLAGLVVLRKFLLRYFSDIVTAITLLLLMFGTNLYFYTIGHIGMSHHFSFALFCFVLYYTERAYSTGRSKYMLLLGAALGMTVILRPTNILVAMLPLFWPCEGGRVRFLRDKIVALTGALFLFMAVLFIQFGYLKYTSGSWFHFSYQEEGFHFLSPEIMNGLFSYRKGWFLYTPIALLALCGLIPLMRTNKKISILIFTYILVNIYIVFSWCQWWYGGSFGCRALVESLAVLAMPLAAVVRYIADNKGKWLKVSAAVAFVFFISLNIFQSYQLINHVTMWDDTNKAFYWRSFGKLKVTDEDRALLNPSP